MVQLEFLQGEHVNHHGNFRGQGGKKLALDIFLCSGGCGTQMNSSSYPSAAHPSPPTLPTPSPPKAIPLRILGAVPCKAFSLKIYQGSQQENGSSDFPF